MHYFRGQIAYAKGNLETAANEFAAAKAAGGTEAEPASFYQGLTYIRMRQLVQARASFQQTTIDPERDPTVAAAARQLDAVLAQQQAATGPAKPWEAELTISYVYDSNVIQLGSDAQLPTGISHKADSRTVLQPRGSYSLFHNDKVEIGVEGSGYFAYEFDLNDFDTYSYQIGPFISYKFSPNLYGRLSYAFNYIELGHDPYLNRNIVTPSLTYVEPKLGYTQAYYQFEARQFSDTFTHQDDPNSFDNRDALDRDGQDHTFGLVQGINLPEIFPGAGTANMPIDYRLIDQETHGSDYDGLFNQVGRDDLHAAAILGPADGCRRVMGSRRVSSRQQPGHRFRSPRQALRPAVEPERRNHAAAFPGMQLARGLHVHDQRFQRSLRGDTGF